MQLWFLANLATRSFQVTSRRCYPRWHQLVVAAEMFYGKQELVRLSRSAHAEVRALLQFHAGGTKNNRRHRHRKSCLGFNGEPHGLLVLFLFSAQKLLRPGYFPRNHRKSALSQSGQGSWPNIPFFPFMVIIWPLRGGGGEKKVRRDPTKMWLVGSMCQVVP